MTPPMTPPWLDRPSAAREEPSRGAAPGVWGRLFEGWIAVAERAARGPRKHPAVGLPGSVDGRAVGPGSAPGSTLTDKSGRPFDALARPLRPGARGAVEEGTLSELQLRGHAQRLDCELRAVYAALASLRAEPDIGSSDPREVAPVNTVDGRVLLPGADRFRARLQDELRCARGRPPTLAALAIGIHDFDAVAEGHGPAMGDTLPTIVSHRLGRAVRAGDRVSHTGGGEFTCLVSCGMQHAQLTQLACRLFDTISAPMRVGAALIGLQASIGIAVGASDGIAAAALLDRARVAMCQARQREEGYAFSELGR